MANLIGLTLSKRYHIEESLGRGGMAEVYKAWDNERATYLALKVLRQDLAQDTIFLRRFQREARTLEKLQHPNIVRFYGIETDDLLVFMLMDFIEGTTLQAEIFRSRGRSLSQDFIALCMNSICSALHYAHRQGLVHCDIKPGNIMINQHGEVLLTDFGIARMTDTATATMVGFGTPAYMAPELVRGQDPTPQSDIYSLGVVLYEMVTGGERPFTGERAQTTGMTSEKVRWEQVHLAPPSPRTFNPIISAGQEAVIMKCLAKAPEERFAGALDLLSDLKLPKVETLEPQEPEIRAELNPKAHQTLTQADLQDNASKRKIRSAPPDEKPSRDGSKLTIDPIAPKKRMPTWLPILLIIGLVSICGLAAASVLFPRLYRPKPIASEPTKIETVIDTKVVVSVDETTQLTHTDNSKAAVTKTNTSAPTATKTHVPTQTPTEEPTLGIGSTMINPVDGAVLVYVPEGEFLMGSEDSVADSDEAPEHKVWLDAFWIYQHEVTNQEYRTCVDAGQCISPSNNRYYSDPEYRDHPVLYVDWNRADAYCQWAGGQLPTEAEWEKAARGDGDSRKYPWGNADVTGLKANYCDRNCENDWKDNSQDDDYARTAPVGSYLAGASPYGALDMAGNVWEWVADWYDPNYYSRADYKNPTGPPSGTSRVLRGGSWFDIQGYLRFSFRGRRYPGFTGSDLGFRCLHLP